MKLQTLALLFFMGLCSSLSAQGLVDFVAHVQTLKKGTLLLHPKAMDKIPQPIPAKMAPEDLDKWAQTNKLVFATVGQFIMLTPSNQVARFSVGNPEGYIPSPGVVMAGLLQLPNMPLSETIRVFETYSRRKYIATDAVPAGNVIFKPYSDLTVSEILFGMARLLELNNFTVELTEPKTFTVKALPAPVVVEEPAPAAASK